MNKEERKVYAKNLAALKRCKRVYNIVFWVYFFSCIPYVIATLVSGLFNIHSDAVRLSLGVIFKLMLFATGILGIYKKEKKFVFYPIPLALCCMCTGFFDIVYLPITIVSAMTLTTTNKIYKNLEEQEGFPYFNERFEEKKDALAEYENDNPYKKLMEKYKETSDTMDEI